MNAATLKRIATRSRAVASPESSPFAVKTVLVPVDFSEGSRKALKYAGALFKQFGATVVLLHVANFQYAGSEPDALELAEIETTAVAARKRELAVVSSRELPTIPCKVIVSVGKVVPEIIAAARTNCADIIVIATRGRPRADADFLGSTTERVVRHAPCPVLVVREKERECLRQI